MIVAQNCFWPAKTSLVCVDVKSGTGCLLLLLEMFPQREEQSGHGVCVGIVGCGLPIVQVRGGQALICQQCRIRPWRAVQRSTGGCC